MYLHKIIHDGKEPDAVAGQLIGWVYESHCWFDDPEEDHKKCLWCDSISREDMKMEGLAMPVMCAKNPLLSGEDLMQALELLGKAPVPNVDGEVTNYGPGEDGKIGVVDTDAKS